VLFHRRLRQRQLAGDALVAPALRHLAQHVELARGEPGQRRLAQSWSTLLVGTPNGLAVLTLPLFAAAVVSLAVRFRAGGREVREQIKWLAFMMALMLAAQVVALIGIATTGGSMYNPVTGPAYAASAVIVLAGMPGSSRWRS